MSVNHRYLNQIVKLVPSENEADGEYTGRLVEIIADGRGEVFTRLRLEGVDELFFLTDFRVIPVEIDGKRLPETTGVYAFKSAGYGEDEIVQLTDDSKWFPHPYSFSGWREGELLTFDSWEARPDLTRDIPDILNPEDASLVERLIAEFSTLSNVDADEASALARKLVLNDRLFG